jgi:6-pyruvoyltetrahydropterin/6-carboxytetrahydropterin synthase
MSHMPYSIAKSFSFSSSHVLDGLPPGHKCGRVHGHNYVVDVELSGVLNEAEMILDYGLLDPFAAWLSREIDHRHLNDVVDGNPTAEFLAAFFYDHACKLLEGYLLDIEVSAVRVHETPKTTAEYRE